ncbi:hypothetical protein LLG46_09530 [bacterium]|nr:hypothetical protein [bacterium]
MLKIHGRKAGIAFLTLAAAVMLVCLFALIQVYAGPGKRDANTITSPWNFSNAPPQSISRNNVRIVSGRNLSFPGHTELIGKTKNNSGVRTASTASMFH